MGYLLRRLLLLALQLLAVSFVIYAIFSVPAGDYFSTAAIEDPRRTAASVEALRETAGMERTVAAGYARWLKSTASGDLGLSLAYRLPVRELLVPRLKTTLQLAGPALLLAWAIGLFLAFSVARFDLAAWQPAAAFAALVPDVVAVSLLLWLGLEAGFSPTGMRLPLVALTLSLLPIIVLHAAPELHAAKAQEFVRLAQARGVRALRLWRQYILPAAANPLLSLAGLSLSGAIASSFVVEVLTGWPGLGMLFVESVQSRDYPVVQSVLVGLSALLMTGNLLVDLALYRLDPRIRSTHV